jgi:hypothetical protein
MVAFTTILTYYCQINKTEVHKLPLGACTIQILQHARLPCHNKLECLPLLSNYGQDWSILKWSSLKDLTLLHGSEDLTKRIDTNSDRMLINIFYSILELPND